MSSFFYVNKSSLRAVTQSVKKTACNIVWFKRDLRLHDHESLRQAIQSDLPLILCYCFEPSLLQSPDSSTRHFRFIYESLQSMQQQLEDFNIPLYIFHKEVVEVFEILSESYAIQSIFAHQETGNLLTFDRDKAVIRFCKKHAISFKEYRQDGVVRRLKSKTDWTENWEREMNLPIQEIDLSRLKSVEIKNFDDIKGPELPPAFTQKNKNFQPGGEIPAWRYLKSFVEERGKNYMQHISKPALSRKGCARISPYLAFGNLSTRQVYQFSRQYKSSIGKRNYENFISRVWWRSHFIQKLESYPIIEIQPTNKGFIPLQQTYSDEHWEAWINGKTGYPMVDASIRCLTQTGYLNFRMRAMTVSFATFSLWLDWRKIAFHLAKLFLDYEPGIHYAQIHMQSGLTGYNTLRVYNPTEQIIKHDTDAVFIKKWLPELANIPSALVIEPWKMTSMEQTFYGCEIGKDYPYPIIDFKSATQQNKARYWEYRKSAAVKSNLNFLRKKLFLTRSNRIMNRKKG